MSTITRIMQLMSEKGKTQKELTDFLNINKSSYSAWKNGKSKSYQKYIDKIAEFLDTTTDFLMCRNDNPKKDTSHLPDNIIPIPKTKKIPLIGTIACGTPILAEENIEKMIDIADGVDADFALICKGDSMINARINDGDIVYIRSQSMVDNGEIAAVLIGDNATLKRVTYYSDKNLFILKAENPKYEDMVFSGAELNEIKILGKAVAFLSTVI